MKDTPDAAVGLPLGIGSAEQCPACGCEQAVWVHYRPAPTFPPARSFLCPRCVDVLTDEAGAANRALSIAVAALEEIASEVGAAGDRARDALVTLGEAE